LGNVPSDEDSPLVGVQTRPKNPTGVGSTVDRINETGDGLGLVVKDAGEGLVIISTNDDYATKLSKGGHLGDGKRFQRALSDVEGTVVAMGYVDLGRILAAQADKGGRAEPLKAVGIVVSQHDDVQDMRIRVVAG
jgi:hypothetical protein